MYFLYYIFTFATIFNNLSSYFTSAYEPKATSSEVEKPLFLTPLIESNRITEARQKSQVVPFFPNIVSNSGFFTVNRKLNANLFFWFFQKTHPDWINAPVLLWLQGGPGCSSLLAVFKENGPYIFINGTIHKRRYSWSNNYNVLYIDNPIGSGFSFANNYYAKNEEEIAQHIYESLLQFFQLYPELKINDFYLSGESYAGKYIPAVAQKIHKSNPLSGNHINLKGLIIGNGFTDPENMLNFGEHLHRLGLMDYRTKMSMEPLQNKIKILIRNGLWNDALSHNGEMLRKIREVTEFQYLYDYVHYHVVDQSWSNFIQSNQNQTRRAIHVGKLNFNPCSNDVVNSLKADIMQSVKFLVEDLLEHYPILFYNGLLDIRVAHFLTTEFINSLDWRAAEEYHAMPRNKWYVDDRLAGYYKAAGNLKYAVIRDAGHMVPASRPKVMMDLLHKFITSKI